MQRRSFLKGGLVLALSQFIPASLRGAQKLAPHPKKGKYLENYSWKQAESLLRDTKVVLIPLGARTKEHGLHLPLNNDWIMAEKLTARILDRCDVVTLPTVQYGFYPAFVDYPGSVNISKETSRDLIADICRSIHRHGPKKFYVLNTGVSTRRALEPARELLAKEGIWLEYTHLLEATEAVEKKVKHQTAGTHADEIETSVMLYLAPEIVHMNLAQKDVHEDHGPGPLSRDANTKTGVYSPTGAWGDPTLATREKGRLVTEALLNHIEAFLGKFQSDSFEPTPLRKEYL